MTVGQKVHNTLASLESAVSDLKTFALDTQDKGARQMYSNYSQQLESIVQGIRGRTNYLEQEEQRNKPN